MAEATKTTTTTGRQARLAIAHAASDRADIIRHLLRAEPVSCRLSLALELLERLADDIAELAGACDERERREAETIARAAEPRPKRRRTILQKLDRLAFVTIVGLALLGAAAWIGASVAIRAGWL